MKTKEELNKLKEEIESLNKKLTELSEEELVQVTGGTTGNIRPLSGDKSFGFIRPDQEDDEDWLTYKKDIGSDKNAKVIF